MVSMAEVAIGVMLLAGGIGGIVAGFMNWRQMRLIQDTPTETVQSAAAGRTELKGVGRALESPLGRMLGDERCLVSRYKIERWDNARDDANWTAVAWGTVYRPFQVDDDTGTMRVEPDENTEFVFDGDNRERRTVAANEAEPDRIAAYLRAHTDEAVDHSDGVHCREKRRYTEKWIPVGAELYLLGGSEPTERSETNTSGLVLRRDETADEFIVSTQSEAELVKRRQWHDLPLIIGGIVASAVGLEVLLDSMGIVGIFLGLLLLVWLLVRNRLD